MMTSYWHASALYALTKARCVQILFGSLHHSVALHVFDFFFLFNVKGTIESTLAHPLRLLILIVLLCHLSYTHLAG